MVDWRKHIESNPEVLYGKPKIINTRISVDLILEKMASGDTPEDILTAYPQLKKESILACLMFASESIKNEVFFSRAS